MKSTRPLGNRQKERLEPIASPFVKLDRAAASQAAMSGDNWHNHLLALVGSWVAKGNTDDEIHVLAAAQTLPGYTPEQTYAEVQKMIDGARSKGFDKQPNSSAPKSAPPPRQILTMIGDIEIKDPDYLVDGTIETPALIGLIGPSGSGQNIRGTGYGNVDRHTYALPFNGGKGRASHYVSWRGPYGYTPTRTGVVRPSRTEHRTRKSGPHQSGGKFIRRGLSQRIL